MTLSKTGTSELSNEEWNELISLKDAINHNIASVHPEKQEKFTYLFVKSLSYVGNADK